jgi:hypothetical protein
MTYIHIDADGRVHYLHGKTVDYPGGRRVPVYWFARRARPGLTLEALPPGYRVAESPVTGRPYLRKT